MTKEEHLENLIEKGKDTRFKTGPEQVEVARQAGIKSGEVRRENAAKKRDAREAARYILNLKGSAPGRENTKTLGASDDDGITNMEILKARLYSMFIGGNLEAGQMFLTLAGFDPKENRAERESLSSDLRKKAESEAKLRALGSAPDNTSMAINMGDDDGNEDVVFYIPKMLTEEDCKVTEEETAEGSDKTEG